MRTLLILFILFPALVGAQQRYRHSSTPEQRADAIIYVYLDGGASQTDTFDPKPGAGRNYHGKYTKPIPTNVEGLMIGPRLRNLAKIADLYSVIRTMTNGGVNAHETAHYMTLTGDLTGNSIVYPSFCSMISYLKEEDCKSDLFPYFTITAASTRFNEAGFLPSYYKPYDTGGNPDDQKFNVDGIVSSRINNSILSRRENMIKAVDALSEEISVNAEIRNLNELQDKSFNFLRGDSPKAFDLSEESESVRDRYGRTKFGQSCLVARRLVERGVMCVCVRFVGWDTHKEHFARMDERLDDLDTGLSALLEDLNKTGLLKRTIVVCGGEFGRTPRIAWEAPWNGGRGHWGSTYSYLVAGGGFKGGEVIGTTNSTGEKVVTRPVYPADLIASIYTLMGIDPTGEIEHPTEGYIPLLPSLKDKKTSAGILKELFE